MLHNYYEYKFQQVSLRHQESTGISVKREIKLQVNILTKQPRTKDELNPHSIKPGSNPGHIGGRATLSLLHHPCSPNFSVFGRLKKRFQCGIFQKRTDR